MTQYFLHGWYRTKKSEKNKIFFSELLQNFSKEEKTNVLIILFAREKEVWEKKFEQIKNSFLSASPKKDFHFEQANEENKLFIKQIKKSQILFITGGNSHILQNYLEKIPALKKLLRDKIIVWSSAGWLVFSRYYYENDDNTYNKWLGFIDAKLLCHYDKNTNEEAKKKLEKFWEKDIVVYALKEQEFIVVEK